MSNERPDDFLSWRRTLNQPDALSEHGLEDKEISWEKLAERLRDKPRRRWTGYWIAAACLLLALVPVARLFREHPRPESPRPVALRSTALHPTALHPAAPASATPAAAPPAAMPLDAPQETAPPTLASRHITLTRQPSVAALPQPTTLPKPARITAGPVATETGPLTAALTDLPVVAPPQPSARPTTPIKTTKQLRIVNINEITRGTNPTPATARREPGFLRIGTTIPDPPGSSEDNPALLKIKLSQNR
jgi:hypothetical protein